MSKIYTMTPKITNIIQKYFQLYKKKNLRLIVAFLTCTTLLGWPYLKRRSSNLICTNCKMTIMVTVINNNFHFLLFFLIKKLLT
jgi:uncharacterized membrane protein